MKINMGSTIAQLAAIAILSSLICCLLIFPACSGKNNASTATRPIRFLDDPDFVNSLKDYYDSLQHEKTIALTSDNWVKVGNTTDGIPAYFLSVPQDFAITFQATEGPDRTRILRDGEEIAYMESRTHKAVEKEEYWKFSKAIKWPDIKSIFPGTSANFRIRAEYSETRLIANLNNIKSDATVRISLDGKNLAILKGGANPSVNFDRRISVAPGEHVLTIEHNASSGRKNGAIRISPNSSIGLGNGILFFTRRDPRNMSMEMTYSAIPRGANTFITRVRREKHHYFYQSEYPGSDWMFSAQLIDEAFSYATHRCVPIFSPYSGSWRGRLPENDPELHFVYGFISGKHTKEDGLVVTVRPASAPDEAASTAIDPQNIGREIWYEQRIDLSRWAGRIVDITFHYECSPIKGLNEQHLLIGEPMITSRGGSTASNRPNVVLISLDTCRGDRRAGVGWKRDTMPFLDELASNAINFTNARSQASWTLPSHTSMLTGLFHHTAAYVSGRFDTQPTLSAHIPTLATLLKENGYLTQAFTDSGLLAAVYGFSQGFDSYDQFKRPWGWDMQIDGTLRIAKKIPWQKVQHWIEQMNSDAPFFLFLHTYGPHVPYSSLGYDDLFAEDDPETTLPPDIRAKVEGKLGKQDVQHIGVVYDRNLRRTDDAVRNVVAALKRKNLYDNTLLIVTSDHGEMLGEHETYGGHGTAWNKVLHIPLIIHLPRGELAGKRITDEVQLVDLTPTILDLLHLPVPDYMQGTSMVPQIKGSIPFSAPFRFTEYWYTWLAHRDGDYRLHLNNGKVAVYNLINDPGELDNLLEDGHFPTDTLDRMVHALMLFYSEMAPGWNILVTPPSDTRLLVTVEDYQWPFESKTGKTRSIDFGAFEAHINTESVEVAGKPALIQLEPPTGGKAFKLSIKKFDESSKKWIPTELPVGIHFGSMERKTPTPISMAVIKKRAPSCRERGASDWLQNYPVCVWFSRNSLEFSGEEKSADLDEEQRETLRNLGYLQ